MPVHYLDIETGRLQGFQNDDVLGVESRAFQHIATARNRFPNLGINTALRAVRADADSQRLQVQIKQNPALNYRIDAADQHELRLDAADLGAGLILPRQGTFLYTPISELRPTLNMAKFQTDGRVAPGATNYSQPRKAISGEAKLYGLGTQDIPTVNISITEDIQRVHTVVTSFAWDLFSMMATDFAGISEIAEKRAAAYRIIDEYTNRLVWSGNSDAKIYGIANHPVIAKGVSPVAMGPLASSTPDEQLQELNRIVDLAYVQSKQVYQPNRLILSPGLQAYLTTTYRASGTDMTIATAFLTGRAARGANQIKSIEGAWELDQIASDLGFSNYHVLLMYNDAPESLALVQPLEPTELPVQLQVFDNKVYVYSRFGGMKCSQPGANYLIFIPKS